LAALEMIAVLWLEVMLLSRLEKLAIDVCTVGNAEFEEILRFVVAGIIADVLVEGVPTSEDSVVAVGLGEMPPEEALKLGTVLELGIGTPAEIAALLMALGVASIELLEVLVKRDESVEGPDVALCAPDVVPSDKVADELDIADTVCVTNAVVATCDKLSVRVVAFDVSVVV